MPMWPFLLTYGSHDVRLTGFRRLTGCQGDPREMGRHSMVSCRKQVDLQEKRPL